MRLWKKASGALKDQNSIFIASLGRRTSLRNPDIEAAVIRATSHDESRLDYRNSDRIFQRIRLFPSAHFGPFAWALCFRMEKTRNWVVALKGLILMHGVLCCRVPAVQKIGRLPFDLSNFRDGHLSPAKSWPYNAFVRAYYAFLDQKSAFLSADLQEQRKARGRELITKANDRTEAKQQTPMVQELVRLEKLQSLLDMLLQIKPETGEMVRILILEAMDCVIIEIFDLYSKLCNGIARVLSRNDMANTGEATMALKVLRKATEQGDNLTDYFEFCRKIGVMNASEKPQVPAVPDDEIRELERIVSGDSKKKEMAGLSTQKAEEGKAIVIVKDKRKRPSRSDFHTIITHEWEVFDEDLIKIDNGGNAAVSQLAIEPAGKNYQELPDLISFL